MPWKQVHFLALENLSKALKSQSVACLLTVFDTNSCSLIPVLPGVLDPSVSDLVSSFLLPKLESLFQGCRMAKLKTKKKMSHFPHCIFYIGLKLAEGIFILTYGTCHFSASKMWLLFAMGSQKGEFQKHPILYSSFPILVVK